MKLDKFEVIRIIKETINEVMDFVNVNNYEYEIHNSTISNNLSLIGLFKLDDGAIGNVYAEKIKPEEIDIPPIFDKNKHEIINIVYSINNVTKQYQKSELKVLIRVLKTVSTIVKDFIQKHEKENPIYILHAESKNDFELFDRQKRELYGMILSKQLPSYYRLSDGKFNNYPVVVFQKDTILEKRYYNKLKKII